MNCWSEIGFQGDSSCPQLRIHVHCRDCQTFRAVAARLLEAPLGAEEMAETASHLAREKPNMVVHSLSVVIFRAGGAWLALPSISVREIIGPRPVHSLPHRRGGAVLGLVNIRGELLVCLALPVVLGLDLPGEDESRPGQAPSRMLVTQQNNARIVYPVEEVAAVQRFQPQDCAPAPALVTKAPANFTKAVLNWRGTPVSLLDEQQLLTTVNRSLASATAT